MYGNTKERVECNRMYLTHALFNPLHNIYFLATSISTLLSENSHNMCNLSEYSMLCSQQSHIVHRAWTHRFTLSQQMRFTLILSMSETCHLLLPILLNGPSSSFQRTMWNRTIQFYMQSIPEFGVLFEMNTQYNIYGAVSKVNIIKIHKLPSAVTVKWYLHQKNRIVSNRMCW